MKLKSRSDLMNKHFDIYRWLLYNNPNLLNKMFPHKLKPRANENKKKLLKMAELNLPRPSRQSKKLKERRLGSCLSEYLRRDITFKREIQKLNPNWLISKNEKELNRTYNNMIKLMPSTVSFCKGQTWTGVRKHYKFQDKKYGTFYGTPIRLILMWKKGLSGHPTVTKNYLAKSSSKYVKNLDTGIVFESLASAAKSVKCSKGNAIRKSILRNGKCGGYKFAYCDKNSNILKEK